MKMSMTRFEDCLTVTAPAKINLHLEVLGLRRDGFHELAMVMQSIDLVDDLELIATEDGIVNLISDDPSLTTGSDNLIIKAAELLKNVSGSRELGASIYLRKRIPIGAGLAGGSSDGAAALVGLNCLWGLELSEQKLINMAAELGSDVPFCVAGGTQLCFGRGDHLEPVQVPSDPMAVLLVKDPSVCVSTPWAYGRYRELNACDYLENEIEFEQRRQDLREETWLRPLRAADPAPLRNDLQKVVAPVTPAVQNALDILCNLPEALSVAMSGSGPSCFALYSDIERARNALQLHRKTFEAAGLASWCCSFRAEGVKLGL